jgi:hypothetical protein
MSEMTEAQREKLATYYSTRSTVDGMSAGEWVNEPAADPMVTTSLRLPVHLMQTVRAMAASEGVKPTALIRRWVEDAVSGRSGWEPSKDDLERLTAKVDQMLGLLGNVVSLNAIKARRAEPKAGHPSDRGQNDLEEADHLDDRREDRQDSCSWQEDRLDQDSS